MKMLFGAVVAATLAAPALAAGYLPVGPQANVSLATLTSGGWTQCYSAEMATVFGVSAATTLSACTGSNLLLAGRATGSSTLLVLAQALKSDVLFDTGNNASVTHSANGTEWYNHDNFSLGFVDPAHTVNKNSCDFRTTGGLRLCIHTDSGFGGYRINDITGLNGSTAYEKLAFTSNGAVPEPAAWALMIAGFGLVGASLRRRRTGYAAA